MQYALINGTREEAKKGQKGICPGCGRPVTAKCGEIVVHHWAHQASEACEFEREGMTQWHLDWQKEFPEHMREVVVGPHRADVKTNDFVIEFQHSSISHEKVQERNEHWGKDSQVIWVANMQGVAKNAVVYGSGARWRKELYWIAGKERAQKWVVQMARKNTAIATQEEFMAFHDPETETVYLGMTDDNQYKYFHCWEFTRKEFVELMLLNNWSIEGDVYGRPEPKKVQTAGEFPGGPAYGETFTWRRREVCYLSVEEMYFADSVDEERLSPDQCSMALTFYMTPLPANAPHKGPKLLAITPAMRANNRLMYEEEVKRARRETRLGEVLEGCHARV